MANFSEIINSEKPVLIDFYADWCGPCKMLSPIIQEGAKELNGKARVLKIDVDKNQSLATKLGIKGVSTMVIYQKGKVMWRQSGVMQKAEIVSKLNQFT
jgi:thioredoxin 1